MHINFLPIRADHRPKLERSGDVLFIDDEAFDFTDLPEGAILPAEAVASAWVAGPLTRKEGTLHLTILLSHGPDAPAITTHPSPLILSQDGPVPLPPYQNEGTT